jgi:hypothetical protein
MGFNSGFKGLTPVQVVELQNKPFRKVNAKTGNVTTALQNTDLTLNVVSATNFRDIL